MNNIIEIKKVKGYVDNLGDVYLNLEDVAKGLGFSEISNSGNITVRWRTIRKYLKDLKVIATCCDGKGKENLPEFIKENIFYKLCMKANNEIALSFQDKVADEILPQIRKTGGYNLQLSKKELLQLGVINANTENERLLAFNKYELEYVKPLEIKEKYHDKVLDSDGTLTVREIAQDFGKTANWLNKILNDLGIQFKQGKKWHLYSKYKDMGLVKEITVLDKENDKNYTRMKWTQKGRKFIHNLLDNNGIFPTEIIEDEII